MTNELRAKRVKALAMVSSWVDDGPLRQGSDHVILSWSPPKLRQYATISINSGEITRFVIQKGRDIKDGNPQEHTEKIDRRIRYLTEKYRIEVAGEAEQLRQHTNGRYRGKFTDSELHIK